MTTVGGMVPGDWRIVYESSPDSLEQYRLRLPEHLKPHIHGFFWNDVSFRMAFTL